MFSFRLAPRWREDLGQLLAEGGIGGDEPGGGPNEAGVTGRAGFQIQATAEQGVALRQMGWHREGRPANIFQQWQRRRACDGLSLHGVGDGDARAGFKGVVAKKSYNRTGVNHLSRRRIGENRAGLHECRRGLRAANLQRAADLQQKGKKRQHRSFVEDVVHTEQSEDDGNYNGERDQA